ncbi:MAG: N-acetyl-1-D-myo-inositol-2-amino-2-deoxy-alpha-D-glucopyranoside deacetylase [Actinomycetota bacterium]|nr:N-acetyl-1-D-myo-inositol-2-amino-2-deoxy-alpha-D-glucopyranoside deacetylase [Actinomycetota bacterium]
MRQPRPHRRVLFVHAHPDDETINNGATMARYVSEGVGVTLLTCTLGEEGEVLVPELAGLAVGQADQLGGYRISELSRALGELGVTDSRFLGGAGRWRDSGMMGTPANDHPRAFWRADPDEICAAVVQVIRDVRPQVLVTYDENGGYGHPDHIQAHRAAMAAFEAAADPEYRPDLGPACSIAKAYWCAIPVSGLKAAVEAMRAAGETFFDVTDAEELPVGTPDELVTTAVDGREHLPAKLAALRAHATQIQVDGPFFALSNNIANQAFAVEYYQLVRGVPGDLDSGDGYETDLFAGLELDGETRAP